MRMWQLRAGAHSLDDLAMVEQDKPSPGPGQVLIRVHACSLNYRDQMIVQGQYFGGSIDRDITPLSDGAGIVEAVGPGVFGTKPGDRVAGTFFQNWRAGPPVPNPGVALGAVPAPGMLSEYVVLPEQGIVPIAESLSFEEAATLPCAGVTAWNALMEGPRAVGPGRSVLLLGTGGVSLLALSIAKAAGARVIATSSSDEKLARIRALGAYATINYRTTPNWGAAAAELAGGGVDHVVEVGGAGTLQQSMAAVGFGGEVALIGVLTREGETGPHALMFKGASLRGIFVGSAAMAIALNRAINVTGIKPVIGRVFDFDAARQAYEYQASADLFGKVVIRVD
jgi:NADPH:quinone reductase-like Zn-dependent oxidoreductase